MWDFPATRSSVASARASNVLPEIVGGNRAVKDRRRTCEQSDLVTNRRCYGPAVKAGGRCLAVGKLGGISRCCPPRQKDAAAGASTQGTVVYLRARSCG